jgi:ribose 5-phosphate isomerase RpiB
MCLTYYEVYNCAHRDYVGVYTCTTNCILITHIDYLGIKCADCEEVDAAEATRKLEEENNALALIEKSKETEEECWKKAIDDFFLYVEANGWVIDGW